MTGETEPVGNNQHTVDSGQKIRLNLANTNLGSVCGRLKAMSSPCTRKKCLNLSFHNYNIFDLSMNLKIGQRQWGATYKKLAMRKGKIIISYILIHNRLSSSTHQWVLVKHLGVYFASAIRTLNCAAWHGGFNTVQTDSGSVRDNHRSKRITLVRCWAIVNNA